MRPRGPALELTVGQRFAKRSLDIVGAVAGLALLGWLIALLVPLARLDTGGSGLFRQTRIGRAGRPFQVYKIRTMRPLPSGEPTLIPDPDRITTLGRFLRATKLDELPQLVNVLVGEMSLVGPRPTLSGFADLLEGPQRLVLSVRPGITGPATLRFRDEQRLFSGQADPTHLRVAEVFSRQVVYPEKVRLDCEYVRNYRFGRDLVYLWLTLTRQRLDEASALHRLGPLDRSGSGPRGLARPFAGGPYA